MQNAVVRQMAILEPIHDHAQTLPVRPSASRSLSSMRVIR